MIPPELLTMGFGAVTGFVFKFMAERSRNKERHFEMMIKSHQLQSDEREKASKRDGESGRWIRRLVIISILFGVVLAPFILAIFDYPIFMQIDETKRSYLFGLIGGGTQTKFVELGGYLIISEVRQSLTAIIGYYFGQSAVTR